MPTAHDHYRRQSAGRTDDNQRLASLAALLAANPTLNPTTAIRSLGVQRPADIRRLRTKFRIEQAKLMATARRPARFNGTATARVSANGAAAGPRVAEQTREAPASSQAAATTPSSLPDPFFFQWCDLSFGAMRAAVEVQSAVTQCWLHLPPVSMALRAQLALSQVGVAIYARNKKHPFTLH